nr:hypothetical protein [uncultured Methanobrevibacter sp.]
MYFLVHILKVLGIDEEIDEILPSEQITFQKIGKKRIFDNFLDFQVLTKSGKILVFEFKKRALTNDDLKQAFEYYDRVHCKQKADVKLIIIHSLIKVELRNILNWTSLSIQRLLKLNLSISKKI